MLILNDYVKDIYGKKCKWKNIICDGLCNNCWAVTDGKLSDEIKPIGNSYSYSIYNCTDYEELILARQEYLDF